MWGATYISYPFQKTLLVPASSRLSSQLCQGRVYTSAGFVLSTLTCMLVNTSLTFNFLSYISSVCDEWLPAPAPVCCEMICTSWIFQTWWTNTFFREQQHVNFMKSDFKILLFLKASLQTLHFPHWTSVDLVFWAGTICATNNVGAGRGRGRGQSPVRALMLQMLFLKFLPISETTMGNGYSTVYGGMQNFDLHLPSFASGIVGLIVLGAIVGAAVYCFRRRRWTLPLINKF